MNGNQITLGSSFIEPPSCLKKKTRIHCSLGTVYPTIMTIRIEQWRFLLAQLFAPALPLCPSAGEYCEAINWPSLPSFLPSFCSPSQVVSQLRRPDGLYYQLVIARAFVNVRGKRKPRGRASGWARKRGTRTHPAAMLCLRARN